MTCKTILCFSGGLDSTVLLYELLDQKNEVHCLNFSYGSKHNSIEREKARIICEINKVPITEVELPFIGKLFNSSLLNTQEELPTGTYSEENMRQTVVPGRNTIFSSIAIGFAENCNADRIALANHSDDHSTYPDTRPEWIASMSLVAYHGTYKRVQVYAPFTNLKKADICTRGGELKVPFEKTWTCYQGDQIHCGRCSACDSRKDSFLRAKISDPTSYSN